jgi:hypothetical protein
VSAEQNGPVTCYSQTQGEADDQQGDSNVVQWRQSLDKSIWTYFGHGTKFKGEKTDSYGKKAQRKSEQCAFSPG